MALEGEQRKMMKEKGWSASSTIYVLFTVDDAAEMACLSTPQIVTNGHALRVPRLNRKKMCKCHPQMMLPGAR